MKKLLYITANPKREEDSFSLFVGREFINSYKNNNGEDQIIELNLYNENIPLIDIEVMEAWEKLAIGESFENLTQSQKVKLSRMGELTNQFMEADKYVFVTPFWNFSVPPMMKAYIDTICVAGKTFKYTENGPIGLLKDKKALHIQASGGIYSTPEGRNVDFGNKYIKTLCNFIGIEDFKSILVEGVAISQEMAEKSKKKSIDEAIEIAKSF